MQIKYQQNVISFFKNNELQGKILWNNVVQLGQYLWWDFDQILGIMKQGTPKQLSLVVQGDCYFMVEELIYPVFLND